jgi:hypothetical protein
MTMNGRANPSKRVDADRLRRAGFPEAMIAEAMERDTKGVLNHEPPSDLVDRTIKACEEIIRAAVAVSEPKTATAARWEVGIVHVWQSAIQTLIRHGFSPSIVRFFARAALATGGGRNDETWRGQLAVLAAYDTEQRPVWAWLAVIIKNPRVLLLCSFLMTIVLFTVFARYDVLGRRIGVTASTEKLAFPPISAEEDGFPTPRHYSEIDAMALRFRETKIGAFQP